MFSISDTDESCIHLWAHLLLMQLYHHWAETYYFLITICMKHISRSCTCNFSCGCIRFQIHVLASRSHSANLRCPFLQTDWSTCCDCHDGYLSANQIPWMQFSVLLHMLKIAIRVLFKRIPTYETSEMLLCYHWKDLLFFLPSRAPPMPSWAGPLLI